MFKARETSRLRRVVQVGPKKACQAGFAVQRRGEHPNLRTKSQSVSSKDLLALSISNAASDVAILAQTQTIEGLESPRYRDRRAFSRTLPGSTDRLSIGKATLTQLAWLSPRSIFRGKKSIRDARVFS